MSDNWRKTEKLAERPYHDDELAVPDSQSLGDRDHSLQMYPATEASAAP